MNIFLFILQMRKYSSKRIINLLKALPVCDAFGVGEMPVATVGGLAALPAPSSDHTPMWNLLKFLLLLLRPLCNLLDLRICSPQREGLNHHASHPCFTSVTIWHPVICYLLTLILYHSLHPLNESSSPKSFHRVLYNFPLHCHWIPM